MKKRLLCGLLSLGLVLSQLPAAVLAAEAPVEGQNQEAMEEESVDDEGTEEVSSEVASSEAEKPSEDLSADDAIDAESGQNTDGGAETDQDTAANAEDSQDAIVDDVDEEEEDQDTAGGIEDSQDAIGNDTTDAVDGQNAAGDEADVPADSVLTENTDNGENGTANEEIDEQDAASLDIPEEEVETEAPVEAAKDTSGTCGEHVTWALEGGTLTVSGSGDMENYGNLYVIPWYDIKSGITSVVIGDGVTSVGDYAFSHCGSIKSVTFADSVKKIGQHAFENCDNDDFTSVTTPDGASIGTKAFDHCAKLESVQVGEGVTALGDSAFTSCTNLKSIYIPDSVRDMGESTFYACSKLESITIPQGVTEVKTELFRECYKLNNVVIPDSVQSIGKGAFWQCSALSSLTIPDSVTGIGADAFESTPWLQAAGNVVVINGNLITYQGTDEQLVIPDGVTRIVDKALYYNQTITSVTIPDSVQEIGEEAFWGCSKIPSIILPANLKTIGKNAFRSCSLLESVVIPDGVTGIGGYAFYSCSKLADVTIPSSVTGIGDAAFLGTAGSLTIHGYSGSYAQTYAKNNSITFDAIGGVTYPLISSVQVNVAPAAAGKSVTPGSLVSVPAGAKYMVEDVAFISSLSDDGVESRQAQTLTAGKTYYLMVVIMADDAYDFADLGDITISVNGKAAKVKEDVFNGTPGDPYSGVGLVLSFQAQSAQPAAKQAQAITVKSSASSLAAGKTATISVTGAKGAVSYKSSDTAVATVSSAGLVTAKKVGTATITATAAATGSYNAASKTVTIKVVPAATTSLTASCPASGIKLAWKRSAGATGYKVYRGSTLIATIKSGATVTYTDKKASTNGKKYTFKVVPTAATGAGPAKTVTAYRVARPSISSLKSAVSGEMNIKWGKNAKATGYQIQYSRKSSFSGKKTVTISKKNTAAKTIAKLAKGKKFYVRIRTYKTVSGKKYYSAWSAKKTVTIKQ